MATVFYHANCFDGLAAAHTAQTAMIESHTECELIPVYYGKPLPKFNSTEVYFVDWCPKLDMLEKLATEVKKIVIIDHHEDAFLVERDLPSIELGDTDVKFYLGADASGCILTARYFGIPVYRELVLIDDRDRWQHKYGDETLANYLSMNGLKTVDEYDTFIRTDYRKRLANGLIQADLYKRIINASIPSVVDLPKYFVKGKKIGVVTGLSLPLSSDACHLMLSRDSSLDAVVNVHYDLANDIVYMSWRSTDDVSAREMATMFTGGGGHKNAAGAQCSLKTFKEVIYDAWPSI